MKIKGTTIFTFSMLFLLSGVFTTVQGSENLEVIAIDETKTIRMELNTPAESQISVKVLNDYSRTLYSDQISAGMTFEDEIDFSSFREGTYTLISELGNMRVNRTIEVRDNTVEYTGSYISFIPDFLVVDDILRVQYINNFQSGIGISITDESGLVLDAYDEGKDSIFVQDYSLQRLAPGNYTISLMIGTELFSHDFTIDWN